jgi:hypothetical protein
MPTGLPRPKASPGRRYDDDQLKEPLPLPWINGDGPDPDGEADFYAFRDDCSRAASERLCCICGDPLGRVVTLGAMSGDRLTSGGWGHPRCIHMAVRLCPHFAKIEGTVAWLHQGPGFGVVEPATFEVDVVSDDALPMSRDALASLAKSDPWGTSCP